ncbi:MAG: hypothetical protein IPH11_12865 [Ignavibacteriales bacterium]|nr:hypothetical protein [Ignavibacteriales bacterium]
MKPNGLNSNPLLEYTFRLGYNSPAKDAGATGLTETDYFDNGIKTSSVNLVTNGTFDDSTGWVFNSSSITISGGQLNIGGVGFGYIQQAYPFEVGKGYLVSLDVAEEGDSGATVLFYFYNTIGIHGEQGQFKVTVGHKEFIMSAINNNILGFLLEHTEIINASIDNLTIQELKRDLGATEIQ